MVTNRGRCRATSSSTQSPRQAKVKSSHRFVAGSMRDPRKMAQERFSGGWMRDACSNGRRRLVRSLDGSTSPLMGSALERMFTVSPAARTSWGTPAGT